MQFQNKAYFNYDNKDQYFHFASMILDHWIDPDQYTSSVLRATD